MAAAKVGLFALSALAGAALLCSCSGPKAGREAMPANGSTVSVEPSSGAGADAVFSVAYSSSADSPVRELRLLINSALDGRNGCYVYYIRDANEFALVQDEGSGTIPLGVGTKRTVENSQCSLDDGKSSLIDGPNATKIQLGLHFKPSFAGKKNIYAYAENAAGNTGLVLRGQWDVTVSAP